MRLNQTLLADSGWAVMVRRGDGSELPAVAGGAGRSVCGRTCFRTRDEARRFLRGLRENGLTGRVCEVDVRMVEVGG